jgi:hypothetical protein
MNDDVAPITDEASAIAGLSDMLTDMFADEPKPRRQQVEQAPQDSSPVEPELDAAPDEEPASQDDDADENDTPQESIAAPQSWKADDRELFAELPPEIQKVISDRDREAKSEINRRMSLAAETRKQADAEAAKVAQVSQQYATNLQYLYSITLPEMQQLEQVDWAKLSVENPAEYVRLSAVRDGLRQRLGTLEQQFQVVSQQQTARTRQQQQQRLAEQFPLIQQKIPEFSDLDSPKAHNLVNQINGTMKDFGFTDGEIESAIGDARILHLMAELARYKTADKARQSAMGKKASAPAPRMIAQTAAPTRGDRTKGQRIADQLSRMKQTKTEASGIEYLKSIL